MQVNKWYCWLCEEAIEALQKKMEPARMKKVATTMLVWELKVENSNITAEVGDY